MGIDLTIPGNPDSVWALAEWLDPNLNNTVNDLEKSLRRVSADSNEAWQGAAGNAFRDALDALSAAMDPVDNYAADIAEVLRAYARRLERGMDEFAGYAEDARNNWLTVIGFVVAPPMKPKQYMGPPGTAPPIERGPNGECISPLPIGAYEESVKTYNEIAKNVGRWWGELEQWVDEHLVPLMTKVTEFESLAKTEKILSQGTDTIRGFVLDETRATWKSQLDIMKSNADAAQIAYDTHSERLRSGNPSVRAEAERFTKPELRAARDVLDGEVRKFKIGTRIIPVAGVAIDIVAAGADVAAGGSVSSAAVGVGGGFVGGLVVGAAAEPAVALVAGAVAAPELVVIGAGVAIAAAAVAAGNLATWGWESSVPLDVREAIDAGDFGYVFQPHGR